MGVGRKRLPDAVHQRRGTLRKDRHGDPDEKLQLEAHIGEPPEWMADEGKKEWFRVAGAMKDLGILTRLDRAVLTSYCTLWASLVQCGGVEFKAADYAQLRALCSEMGFTPSARTKLIAPSKPKPKSGFADL